jgi:hypothetical protein
MDEPIQRFVREVVRDDPAIAMTWAEAIVNEERKERTVTEVKKVAERIAKQNEANAMSGTKVKNNGEGIAEVHPLLARSRTFTTNRYPKVCLKPNEK